MTRLHWFQVTMSSLQYAEHIATLLKTIFRFSDVNCCMIHRLVGEGVEAEVLSKETTIIVLLIKMIYRDKIMGKGLAATVTNLEEIREYGKNTNLLNQKLPDGEWKSALAIMKKHQIVEYPGALRDLEDDTPIYIYSTINLYCSSALINELIEAYREENAEDEAGKEDIYTNFDE